jgi:hypothetical protein
MSWTYHVRPRDIIIFYVVLFAALSAYTLHRYNGFDLWILLNAGKDFAAGRSPYHLQADFQQDLPFRYAPPVAIFSSLFATVAQHYLNLAMFFLSLGALARLTWLNTKLFEISFGLTHRAQKPILLFFPWLLVVNGLGAQLEGGNTNLLALYLLVEGTYLFAARPATAAFLMMLPALVKPQFGFLAFLFLLLHGRAHAGSFVRAGSLFALVLFSPFLWGVSQGQHLYVDWLRMLELSTPPNLTNQIGNGNLSLYSFLCHIWHWPPLFVTTLVLVPTVAALSVWVSKRKSNYVALIAALWVGYLFSPVSFAYTQTALFVPGSAALALYFRQPRTRSRPKILSTHSAHLFALVCFVTACWITTYNVLGPDLYWSATVYRIHAWLCLPLILAFF